MSRDREITDQDIIVGLCHIIKALFDKEYGYKEMSNDDIAACVDSMAWLKHNDAIPVISINENRLERSIEDFMLDVLNYSDALFSLGKSSVYLYWRER